MTILSPFFNDKPFIGFRNEFLGGTSVGGFTPRDLFRAGEVGAWYDPSDVADLAWRRNLLVGSDTPLVVANGTYLPIGTTLETSTSNASGQSPAVTGSIFLKEDASTGAHERHLYRVTPSIATHTISFFVERSGAPRNLVVARRSTGSFSVTFDFDALTAGSLLGSATSASVQQVAANVFRCVITYSETTGGLVDYRFGMLSGLNTSYAGDNASGLLIYSAQLELGSTATTYQRITDVHTEVRARFPSTTLYQDVAGTQPVTTAGQRVALMLDKSRGLTLGAELVTNGTFDANVTGWSAGNGTVTWDSDDGGSALVDIAGSGGGIADSQTITVVAGRTYVVSVKVKLGTYSGALNLGLDASATVIAPTSTYQTFTTYYVAADTDLNIALTRAVATTGTIYVSSISVRELPGNHATQSVLAQRPTYAVEPVTGRRNLLTYTEEFDNAAWTKIGATVSANVDTAPDGTQSADRLQANSGTVSPLIAQNITVGACSASIYAKAGTSAFIQLSFNGDGTSYVNFDLSLGSVGTSAGTASGTITALGSGWYRCSVANSATNITGFVWSIVASSSALRRASFSATGSENFLIWGAQVETGSTATAYQRVISAQDVSESGVAPRHYLFFDGIDDGMLTSTITPGADKAQVFAGVRKLSDAAATFILETGVGAAAGSWYIGASSNAGDGLRRTWFAGLQTTATTLAGASGFVSPDTRVLAALFDRAQATQETETLLRLNGVLQTPTFINPGVSSGNFEPLPLYIGRRAGTSFPFNGHLYGAIVRFSAANLSASQIAAAERWLAVRTGVSI